MSLGEDRNLGLPRRHNVMRPTYSYEFPRMLEPEPVPDKDLPMNPLTQASEPLSEDLYRVRTLIAAIIRQAVDDIKVRPPGKRSKSQVSLAEWERNKNTAVEFLVSESARSYFKFLRIDRDNALTALNLTLEMALHDKDRTLYEVTDEMSDFFERETLIKERADAEPTE